MSKALVAFNYDPDIRAKENQSGRNYWHEYIKEICDRLGIEDPHLSGESLVRGLAGVLFAEQGAAPRGSLRGEGR